MTPDRDGDSVERLAAEKNLLTQEIWVSRRAAAITAQLVVEQFEKMEEVQRRLEEKAVVESALNALLSLSLADLPQEELLDKALDQVVSTPWLAPRAQGAILLAEDGEETLVMRAQRSLPESVRQRCARVRFGSCLCGCAAAVRELVFAADLGVPGQSGAAGTHGAYCVPMMSSGTLLGVLTVYVDAEHRRDSAEEAFLRAAADILAGVIERGRIVERLRQATKAADAANRAKSTFLANMSHELRTPLNAIIGYSEMLQEEAGDAGQEDFVPDLKKIQAAGRHLLELINAVLDLSKVEAGKMELYLETFDLGEMVPAVAAVVQPLVKKNANSLDVSGAGEAGRMRADLTKLRQALLNLLSNACKFTEHGNIRLRVTRETVPEGEGGDRIAFTVEDTGIGMTPEQAAKIFQPFTQADSGTSRQFGGTGLGLTITERFCHMMGGAISVESAPGAGTRFTMRIPADVALAKQVESAGTAAKPAPETAVSGTRVLVIDDEFNARDLIQRFLGKEGFSVVTASSGAEGLRLARASLPDAITLDVIMPGMDGWAVLRELKADPELANIPVIMLTMVDSMNLGYALGAVEYMTKPVDRERLLAVMEKYRHERTAGTALIVEDDPAIREMLRRRLEREEWTVGEAGNGRVALEWLEQNRADVILLDLMMPEMDGFEFVERWRMRDDWRSTPILVVTAKDLTEEDRLRLDGYVQKIIQKGAYGREQLLNEIRGLVEMCVRRKVLRDAGMKG
ncbi:MAG: response regulator [Acidobacteriota bacterium]|nr:response regulator [Acidobacteriota bacterium]